MQMKRLCRTALVAVTLLAPGTAALAQGIEFGPGGIRIDPYGRPPPPPPRYEPRYDGISEREAIRIARRQGLEEVTRVRPTPRGWVVGGLDRRGDDMRVIVSRDGEVIDVN